MKDKNVKKSGFSLFWISLVANFVFVTGAAENIDSAGNHTADAKSNRTESEWKWFLRMNATFGKDLEDNLAPIVKDFNGTKLVNTWKIWLPADGVEVVLQSTFLQGDSGETSKILQKLKSDNILFEVERSGTGFASEIPKLLDVINDFFHSPKTGSLNLNELLTKLKKLVGIDELEHSNATAENVSSVGFEMEGNTEIIQLADEEILPTPTPAFLEGAETPDNISRAILSKRQAPSPNNTSSTETVERSEELGNNTKLPSENDTDPSSTDKKSTETSVPAIPGSNRGIDEISSTLENETGFLFNSSESLHLPLKSDNETSVNTDLPNSEENTTVFRITLDALTTEVITGSSERPTVFPLSLLDRTTIAVKSTDNETFDVDNEIPLHVPGPKSTAPSTMGNLDSTTMLVPTFTLSLLKGNSMEFTFEENNTVSLTTPNVEKVDFIGRSNHEMLGESHGLSESHVNKETATSQSINEFSTVTTLLLEDESNRNTNFIHSSPTIFNISELPDISATIAASTEIVSNVGTKQSTISADDPSVSVTSSSASTDKTALETFQDPPGASLVTTVGVLAIQPAPIAIDINETSFKHTLHTSKFSAFEKTEDMKMTPVNPANTGNASTFTSLAEDVKTAMVSDEIEVTNVLESVHKHSKQTFHHEELEDSAPIFQPSTDHTTSLLTTKSTLHADIATSPLDEMTTGVTKFTEIPDQQTTELNNPTTTVKTTGTSQSSNEAKFTEFTTVTTLSDEHLPRIPDQQTTVHLEKPTTVKTTSQRSNEATSEFTEFTRSTTLADDDLTGIPDKHTTAHLKNPTTTVFTTSQTTNEPMFSKYARVTTAPELAITNSSDAYDVNSTKMKYFSVSTTATYTKLVPIPYASRKPVADYVRPTNISLEEALRNRLPTFGGKTKKGKIHGSSIKTKINRRKHGRNLDVGNNETDWFTVDYDMTNDNESLEINNKTENHTRLAEFKRMLEVFAEENVKSTTEPSVMTEKDLCNAAWECDITLNERCISDGVRKICDCGRAFVRNKESGICKPILVDGNDPCARENQTYCSPSAECIQESTNQSGYYCACKDDFADNSPVPDLYPGEDCEALTSCKNYCKNKGACVEKDGEFFCSCPLGYSGYRCELFILNASLLVTAGIVSASAICCLLPLIIFCCLKRCGHFQVNHSSGQARTLSKRPVLNRSFASS